MKTKIMAIAPSDGWAFIVKEDEIFLLRPPYISSNQIEVSEKDVENAIHLHGFEECDTICDSISEVVKFLKEKYVESMKKQSAGLPSSEELRELLKYANDEVLLQYLKKADEELIPDGKLNAAKSIALDIMKIEKVRTNREMYDLAVNILQKCKHEEEKTKELAIGISKSKESLRDRFTYAVNKYAEEPINHIINSIYKKGQLFPLGY